MLVLFFFLMLIINIFLAVREKVFPFFLFFTNIFIWLLITGSRGEIDLPSYLIAYDKAFSFEKSGIQFVFYWLMDFFRSLGFSFYEFREIFVGIGLIFLYKCVVKLTINPHMVYSSYLVYLIFFDYVQFRNFLAFCFFCLALAALVLHKEYWKKEFVIFIAIATFFHSSFIVYFLFLLIPSDKWNDSKVVKLVAFFAFGFSIIAVLFRNSISFVTDLVYLVDAERSARYADKSTNFGGLYYIGLQVITAVLMSIFVKRCNCDLKNRFIVVADGVIDIQKSLRFIFYIDLLAISFCPMVVFSITFSRLLRNLYLINIVGFSLYLKKNRSLLDFVFLLIYVAMWSLIGLGGQNFQRLVLPLFFTNIFFDKM